MVEVVKKGYSSPAETSALNNIADDFLSSVGCKLFMKKVSAHYGFLTTQGLEQATPAFIATLTADDQFFLGSIRF